jgi:hypothetical protein
MQQDLRRASNTELINSFIKGLNRVHSQGSSLAEINRVKLHSKYSTFNLAKFEIYKRSDFCEDWFTTQPLPARTCHTQGSWSTNKDRLPSSDAKSRNAEGGWGFCLWKKRAVFPDKLVGCILSQANLTGGSIYETGSQHQYWFVEARQGGDRKVVG